MFTRISQYLPICNPFARLFSYGEDRQLTDEATGNTYRYQDVSLDDAVVLVALDVEQVSTILSGERHAGWICELQETIQGMVDAGTISVAREYVVTGSVTVTHDFAVTVEVESEDQVPEAARDLLEEAMLEIDHEYVTGQVDSDVDISDWEAA